MKTKVKGIVIANYKDHYSIVNPDGSKTEGDANSFRLFNGDEVIKVKVPFDEPIIEKSTDLVATEFELYMEVKAGRVTYHYTSKK